MLSFILRRVLTGILLIFVITVISFTLLYASGGDIARKILGNTASEEVVARKASELGLDRPLYVQFWDWITSAVTGDLGRSWFSDQLVTTQLAGRLSVTLSLVIGSILVVAVVATALGVLAARRGGTVDALVQIVAVLGFAIPGFLIAVYLVLIFAINLGWFKATGYIPITTSFTGWLSTVTLPIVALSLGGIAAISQQVRGSVLDAMSRDYVRTLRSRGLSTTRVVYKHVLRNVGGPALALLAVQFVGLVGGAVIVEQMFAIPGIGALTVTATQQGDVPVVMGVVIITAVVAVVLNLVIDLVQGALNPKVRLS